MVSYLERRLGNGDLSLTMATLDDIARTRRMSVVAQEAELGRESLYKSLSSDGNPEFATVLKVVSALGLRLRATAVLGGPLRAQIKVPFLEPAAKIPLSKLVSLAGPHFSRQRRALTA